MENDYKNAWVSVLTLHHHSSWTAPFCSPEEASHRAQHRSSHSMESHLEKNRFIAFIWLKHVYNAVDNNYLNCYEQTYLNLQFPTVELQKTTWKTKADILIKE